MRIHLDNLPSEPALLQHLVCDMAAVVEHRDGEIERLKLIVKKLQRAQFGRRSKRLFVDPDSEVERRRAICLSARRLRNGGRHRSSSGTNQKLTMLHIFGFQKNTA
jgi:hypothetical protein